MAHYVRYLVTDPREVSFADLEQALQAADPAWRIEVRGAAGRIALGEAVYGRVEIGREGDDLFAGELVDLQAAMEHIPYDERKTVRQVMHHATALVVVQVVWENRDTRETLDRLAPLWNWLRNHRSGLLQVDDEGYYGPSGLILRV